MAESSGPAIISVISRNPLNPLTFTSQISFCMQKNLHYKQKIRLIADYGFKGGHCGIY